LDLVAAEEQINSAIERRAETRSKANAEAVTANLSHHQRLEQRWEENRAAWIDYHLEQAARYREAALRCEQSAASLIAGKEGR